MNTSAYGDHSNPIESRINKFLVYIATAMLIIICIGIGIYIGIWSVNGSEYALI